MTFKILPKTDCYLTATEMTSGLPKICALLQNTESLLPSPILAKGMFLSPMLPRWSHVMNSL